MLRESMFFGLVLSLLCYEVGVLIKKKVNFFLFNPLLIAIVLCIVVLVLTGTSYEEYNRGGSILSYLMTPATVCLAVPLYKKMELLKQYRLAIMAAIFSGVLASAISIWLMCIILKMDYLYYITLLPKSITTAIGMGVSEELGGVVTITVVSIVVTGILGNAIGDIMFKLFRIKEPIAKGLAMGTAAHAMGTARAVQMGEIEGAMSSLAVVVAGMLTVIAAPIFAML